MINVCIVRRFPRDGLEALTAVVYTVGWSVGFLLMVPLVPQYGDETRLIYF